MGISLIIHAFSCLTSEHQLSQKARRGAKTSISDGIELYKSETERMCRQRQYFSQIFCNLMIILQYGIWGSFISFDGALVQRYTDKTEQAGEQLR